MDAVVEHLGHLDFAKYWSDSNFQSAEHLDIVVAELAVGILDIALEQAVAVVRIRCSSYFAGS